MKVEFYLKEEGRIFEIEEELYQKFRDTILNIDVMHVKKEYVVKYFTEA